MLNHSLIPVRGARRRPAIAAVAIAILGVALTGATPTYGPDFQTTGTVARVKPSKRPAIEAAFPRDSYRPRSGARLVIFSKHVREAQMQIFRAGTETGRIGAPRRNAWHGRDAGTPAWASPSKPDRLGADS